MNRAITISSVVFVLVLLTVAIAEGKKKEPFKWDKITQLDWSISPDSSKKIFDAVVVFDKVLADDKKLQKQEFYRTLYRRIRILNASARDRADVEVPHMYMKQKVENIWARTVLRNGSVVEMTDENIFEKELIKSKHGKVKQQTFSIPGVSDDCIIEYAIKYKLPAPNSEWIVQQDIPVLRAEMRWILGEVKVNKMWMDLIEDFVVPNYLFLNRYSRPTIAELPNANKPETLLIEIGYVPPFEAEPYSVPDDARKTRLYCYYGSDMNPTEHWGKESRDIEDGLKYFCEKNEYVRELVTRWENLESDSAKIDAAYRWIQDSILNLSYDDLLNDKGKKKKPKNNKSVNDVLKNGYGDRSDIEYTFCNILREMNINAKVAFLKDRMNDLFIREAKYWQMNRTLVSVETRDGHFDFYTCGHRHTPIGMVPWYCEGVVALVAGGTEYLVTIPFSESSFTQSNISYQYHFTEDLEIEGSLSARFTGQDGRTMRIAVTGEDSTDFGDLLKDELEAYMPEAELDTITFEGLENCYEPFRISCDLEFPPISQVGSRILLKPLEYITESDNPFTDPKRTAAVLFSYAAELNESAEFQIPESYTIEAVPQDAMFENDVGSCTVKFVKLGNILAAQRFFTIASPFWQVEYYPQVKELFQAQMDMSGEIVVLSKAIEEDPGGK